MPPSQDEGPVSARRRADLWCFTAPSSQLWVVTWPSVRPCNEHASPPGGATTAALTCCCSRRAQRRLHEQPALTSCCIFVSQESRWSTRHSPLWQPSGAHAARLRHMSDANALTAHRAYVQQEAAAARAAWAPRSTGSRWARGSILRRRGARHGRCVDTMSPAPRATPTAAVQRRRCHCSAWMPVAEPCCIRFVCDVLVRAVSC